MLRFSVFGLLLLSAASHSQEQTPVFRATSDLVLVDVQVLHTRTRAPIASLQARDLRVFEDGVEQEILHFSRDEFPLSVVLLFDLTESVRGVLKRLAEGAKTALAHFKPEDEVAVMVYAGGARLVEGFTTQRSRTIAAIEKSAHMKSDEPAHFNEALYQAAGELRQAGNPSNRRVVIWLTDNLPNVPFRTREFPVHTEIEALRALHGEGVVVAPILLKNPLWSVIGPILTVSEAPKAKAYPPGDAHKYAEATGGQAVGLRGKRLEERLAQLIDELRARYAVGYRPSAPQASEVYRRIRVELSAGSALRPSEWTVLARQGYYGR